VRITLGDEERVRRVIDRYLGQLLEAQTAEDEAVARAARSPEAQRPPQELPPVADGGRLW
jgi:hypothetical protein